MATLPEYLAGRRKKDFARKLGISASQLSQYLSGHRTPSYRRMVDIERATSGQVPVSSWVHVFSNEERKKPNQGASQ